MTQCHLHDAFRDIVRGASVLLRRSGFHALYVFVVTVALTIALPFGADKTGTDRVNTDFRCQDPGQRQGHRIERTLRGRIGNRTADPSNAGDRADINDRTVSGSPERLLGRTHHLEGPEHVDAERSLPDLRRQFLQFHMVDVRRRPGVVDQHVETAPLRHGFVDNASAVRVGCDIALHQEHLRAFGFALRDRILRLIRTVRIIDRDVEATLGQHYCGRLSDAPSRARDNCDIFIRRHFVLPSFLPV